MRNYLKPASVTPKLVRPSDAYSVSKTYQVMACGLFGAKPLSEQMLSYCPLDNGEHISSEFCLGLYILAYYLVPKDAR